MSRMVPHCVGSLKGSCRRTLHGLSITLALISQVFSELFQMLSTNPHLKRHVFQTLSQNVSETYPLEITMDPWSQNNWLLIAAWTFAWLLHAMVSFFRRNTSRHRDCMPEIHPPAFYLIWIIINGARICDMFLWINHNILGVLCFKLAVSVYGFYMLSISYRNLEQHRAWLTINNPSEIWLIRCLTQNGLALFCWWSLVEALVSLGVVLRYLAGAPEPLLSSIVLTVLLAAMSIWFVLESFCISTYVRYTFTVYPILVLGLGAMFTRGYRVHNLGLNTIYCGVLMLLATALNCSRLIAVCFYGDDDESKSNPETHKKSDQSEAVCQLRDRTDPKIKIGITNPVFKVNF